MDTAKEKNPKTFLHDVADAMDEAADQIDSTSNGQSTLATTNREISKPKFGQKLIYTSCYTLSFGMCFPVFLICRYVPKNNPLVEGIVAGGAAASRDVNAWLTRIKESRQSAADSKEEDQIVAKEGAAALARS